MARWIANPAQIEARDSLASGNAAGFPKDDEMSGRTGKVDPFRLSARKSSTSHLVAVQCRNRPLREHEGLGDLEERADVMTG